MNREKTKIIIIGAGLSGLLLAYRFQQKGFEVLVLEARDRIGGRIHTIYTNPNEPIEMGATWLGKKHTALLDLLDEFNIDIFEQTLGEKAIYEPISTSPHQLVTLPPNNHPSYRVKGGTSQLIHHLYDQLSEHSIRLEESVSSIKQRENNLEVASDKGIYNSDYVVSTLPPFLLNQLVSFSPTLPLDFQIEASQTHTWMGESIKVGLTFDNNFWQNTDTSGTIVSNVGPIPEMYDQSNFEESFFALVGFLNGVYFSMTKNQRKEIVLTQLSKYYGDKVLNHKNYFETVWRNEKFTWSAYRTHILPHQNNGNKIFQKAYLGNRLFLAGSETATLFPGYMDGAVRSAERVLAQILNANKTN